MRAYRCRTFWLPLIAGLLFAASLANAGTVATFFDPAPDGSTPLFTLDGATLSGGWSGMGLDLVTPINSGFYPNATFTMTNLTVLDLFGTLSGGTIQFKDSIGNPLLRIDFNEAKLFQPVGFGASTFAGENVVFSGPIITTPLIEQMFSFSFANQSPAPNGASWTAAFTSSAVPEPATLILLVIGGLVAARRR